MTRARGAEPRDSDRLQVKAAARRVGVAVGVASALIVTAIAVVVSLFMLTQSREEGLGDRRGTRGPRGGPTRWDTKVVDVGDILPLMLLLALAGIVLLALIAWLAARRSTEPLAKALRTQQNFVADASHELRTPLTTLDAHVQLAEHRLRTGGDVEDALTLARRDTQTMQQIVDDLLLAAQSSEGGEREILSTSVEDCVNEAVLLTAPQAQSAGVSVYSRRIDQPGPGTCTADVAPMALTRAVVLLLDNAIGHSPDGSTVAVTFECRAQEVFVRVKDQGGGIEGANRDEVFERFSRGRSQRRGFGLGLSLVQDIAARFGGSVAVEETGPSGTTFVLRLPKSPSPGHSTRLP